MRRQMSIRVLGTVLSGIACRRGLLTAGFKLHYAMTMEPHKGYFNEGAALLVHPFSRDGTEWPSTSNAPVPSVRLFGNRDS